MMDDQIALIFSLSVSNPPQLGVQLSWAGLYIPDSVVEIDESCFSGCKNLSWVTFGASCELENICGLAFCGTRIESLSIPDGVVEIGPLCFFWCENLRSVIFGASFKLERICHQAFCGAGIESFSIPDSVVDIGKWCFSECKNLRSVTFGGSSKLERICADAFRGTSIESLSIPDGVVDLTLTWVLSSQYIPGGLAWREFWLIWLLQMPHS